MNLNSTSSTLPLRVQVNFNLKAFTLVELIVVITILAILWTIWFVSYTWFMSTARDSNRLTQLEWIHNWLETYKTKWKLLIPDDSVTIYASWTIIWYQWNAWETVLNKIWYQKWWKDPLDDKYYTYYTDKKQQNIELLWFLENDPGASKETTFNRTEKWEMRTENLEKQELVTILQPFVNGHQILPPFVKAPSLSLGQTRARGFSSLNTKAYFLKPISSANATDYTERIITTFWKKLWILLESGSNNPIQENTTLKTTWLDIVTTTWSYSAVFADKDSITWTWINLVLWYSLKNNTLAVFDNSLIWYWDMEPNSTKTWVLDLSQYKNNWTLMADNANIPRFVDWKKWSVLEFNWSWWVLFIPKSQSLTWTLNITISAWIKPSVLNWINTIVCRHWDTTDVMGTLNIEPNKASFYLRTTSWFNSVLWNKTFVIDNIWHFVVATYNWNKLKVYYDWIFDKETIHSWNMQTSNWYRDTYIWRYTSPYTATFSWLIDDVRLYNRALSDTEILTLYNFTK